MGTEAEEAKRRGKREDLRVCDCSRRGRMVGETARWKRAAGGRRHGKEEGRAEGATSLMAEGEAAMARWRRWLRRETAEANSYRL